MFEWLETLAWAQHIAQSSTLTPALSAVHMLGFTIVTGSAVLANLRLLGLSLGQCPVVDVTRPAARGIQFGLVLSIVTGVLLFSGRASGIAASDFFQLKMLLLLAAVGFHFSWLRYASRRATARGALLRATGVIGLALWLGLAGAACAFILFE